MTPTPEQMRAMGFSANAEPVMLSDLAWLAFCAWVNLPQDRVPAIQRYAPKATAEAWERVANAIANRDGHQVHEDGPISEARTECVHLLSAAS